MLLSCVWDYGENNNSRDRVMTSMCFVIIMFRCVFLSWKQLYLCEMVDMCCMNAFSVSAEVSWVNSDWSRRNVRVPYLRNRTCLFKVANVKYMF